jgi:hypothetical protein
MASDLSSLIASPISAYSAHLAFIREAIIEPTLLDEALSMAESVTDDMVVAIVAAVPDPLLPVAERGHFTNLLNSRRPLLRSLFKAESHIFPNLK